MTLQQVQAARPSLDFEGATERGPVPGPRTCSSRRCIVTLAIRSRDANVLRGDRRMRIYQNPAWCRAMLALAITCAMGGTAAAQWLSLPLPGTPRTADGKPNLNAPTPHTADGKPDLSGIWRADTIGTTHNLVPVGTEAPMLPWAAELYKHRVDDDRLRPADDQLHAARRARCDDGGGPPVQDPPDAGRDGHPVRGIPQVPPDSHRRADAAGRSGSGVVRVLGRPLGGRHVRRRDRRFQGGQLARQQRSSAYRSAAH